MARGVRVHRLAFGRGVVIVIGLLPGFRPVVADDPDELVGTFHRPGAEDLEAAALTQRHDLRAPLAEPLLHLARFDGVFADLELHNALPVRMPSSSMCARRSSGSS